jgi:hypothetical protein
MYCSKFSPRLVGVLCTVIGLSAAMSAASGQDRDTKVRNDRDAFNEADDWVYNDLDAAFKQAELSKKPILAVLRCVP